jgi:hypothetical protein
VPNSRAYAAFDLEWLVTPEAVCDITIETAESPSSMLLVSCCSQRPTV